jgi:hypothetical protein
MITNTYLFEIGDIVRPRKPLLAHYPIEHTTFSEYGRAECIVTQADYHKLWISFLKSEPLWHVSRYGKEVLRGPFGPLDNTPDILEFVRYGTTEDWDTLRATRRRADERADNELRAEWVMAHWPEVRQAPNRRIFLSLSTLLAGEPSFHIVPNAIELLDAALLSGDMEQIKKCVIQWREQNPKWVHTVANEYHRRRWTPEFCASLGGP